MSQSHWAPQAPVSPGGLPKKTPSLVFPRSLLILWYPDSVSLPNSNRFSKPQESELWFLQNLFKAPSSEQLDSLDDTVGNPKIALREHRITRWPGSCPVDSTSGLKLRFGVSIPSSDGLYRQNSNLGIAKRRRIWQWDGGRHKEHASQPCTCWWRSRHCSLCNLTKFLVMCYSSYLLLLTFSFIISHQ